MTEQNSVIAIDYAQDTSPDWLGMATAAYESSTDWLDSNMRKQWERNLSNFQGRHAPGSKYSADAYKGRSRLFMPKTRASMLAMESAVAAAYFSTGDVVNIEARNSSDPVQAMAAKVMTELMNYRLQKTIPWFMTLIGAFQDASVSSICISKQWWEVETKPIEIPMVGPTGEPVLDVETGEQIIQEQRQVVKDQPRIDLIPAENFRIDPAADWLDPVNSSPYNIYRIPMPITKVREKMAAGEWNEMEVSEILTGLETQEDTTRLTRDSNRTGTFDEREIAEYSTVWVHENILRHDGQDWVFWTLDTHKMLTDPVPIDEVYLHGKRPFVVGVTNLEAHRAYPAARVELGQDVQSALNDIVNQRIDNVQLVLNKRYRVQRGKNVDMHALQRSAPGGIVMMDDLNAVVTDPMQDVTGTAYAEQDRMQMAFDEISGTFSNATVQANRSMNETATGMELMSDGSNAIREYTIRIFNETWVEPVLRQLLALEREYETDHAVLMIAAERAEMFEQWRTAEVMDYLIHQDVDLIVNVGMGATNPRQRVEKFLFGLNALGPFIGPKIKEEEVITEVFGNLGYKDGRRFYDPNKQVQPQQDPRAGEAQAEMQIKQQQMQMQMQIEQQKLQFEMQRFQAEMQQKQAEMMMRRDVEIAKAATQERLTVTELEQRMGMTASQEQLKQAEIALKNLDIQTKRQIAALNAQQAQNELAFKARTGRDGI